MYNNVALVSQIYIYQKLQRKVFLFMEVTLSFTRALLKCIIYDVSSQNHVNGCMARLELVLSANCSMVSGLVDYDMQKGDSKSQGK